MTADIPILGSGPVLLGGSPPGATSTTSPELLKFIYQSPRGASFVLAIPTAKDGDVVAPEHLLFHILPNASPRVPEPEPVPVVFYLQGVMP